MSEVVIWIRIWGGILLNLSTLYLFPKYDSPGQDLENICSIVQILKHKHPNTPKGPVLPL